MTAELADLNAATNTAATNTTSAGPLTASLQPESDQPSSPRLLVTWAIDDLDESRSPAEAAARVWRDCFGRTTANDEDACFFTVLDRTTGETTNVDLSEHDLDELLA